MGGVEKAGGSQDDNFVLSEKMVDLSVEQQFGELKEEVVEAGRKRAIESTVKYNLELKQLHQGRSMTSKDSQELQARHKNQQIRFDKQVKAVAAGEVEAELTDETESPLPELVTDIYMGSLLCGVEFIDRPVEKKFSRTLLHVLCDVDAAKADLGRVKMLLALG